MSYQNDDYEIDILGEDWDDFATELSQDTIKEVHKRSKVGRYFFILLLIAFAVGAGVYVGMNSTTTEDTTPTPSLQADQTQEVTEVPPTLTATPALVAGELVAQSRTWLATAEQVALTYQTALSGTDLDCVAVRTDALYAVPDLPDFESAPREDIATVGRVMGQMNSASQLLLEAKRRFDQVCASADTFPNANWGTFSPLEGVEGALSDISTARTTLGEE